MINVYDEKDLMHAINIRCKVLGIENFISKYASKIIPDHIDDSITRENEFSIITGRKVNLFYDHGVPCINHWYSHNIRDLAVKYCGFSLVAREWTVPLAKSMFEYCGRRPLVLEIMSGLGTLTRALRQDNIVDVASVDIHADQYCFNYDMQWDPDIENIDCIEAIKQYKDADFVICSWPRGNGTMTKFVKVMHDVNPKCILIYIGELAGGCCAEDEFFEVTTECDDFDISRVHIPRWYGINDEICAFRYRAE